MDIFLTFNTFCVECKERNTRCTCPVFDALWGKDAYEYHSPDGVFEDVRIAGHDFHRRRVYYKTKLWFHCDPKIMPLITFFNEPGPNRFCEINTKEGKDKAKECLQKLTNHLIVSGTSNTRGSLIWLIHGYKGTDIYRERGPFFEAKNELLKKYPNSIVGIVTWEKAAAILKRVNIIHSRSIPSWILNSYMGQSYQASAIST